MKNWRNELLAITILAASTATVCVLIYIFFRGLRVIFG